MVDFFIQLGRDMFVLTKFRTVWLGFYPAKTRTMASLQFKGDSRLPSLFPLSGHTVCRVSMDNLKCLCGVETCAFAAFLPPNKSL